MTFNLKLESLVDRKWELERRGHAWTLTVRYSTPSDIAPAWSRIALETTWKHVGIFAGIDKAEEAKDGQAAPE